MPSTGQAGLLQRSVGLRARARVGLPVPRAQLNDKSLDKLKNRSQDDSAVERDVGTTPRVSGGFRQVVTSISASDCVFLNKSQFDMVNRVITSLADALAGPGPPPLLRRLLRLTLFTAVLVTYTAVCISILMSSLTQSDSGRGFSSGAGHEMASAVGVMLLPVAPYYTLLVLRVLAASTALATAWLNLGAAAEGLAHLDPQHLDVWYIAERALDLLTSCSDLLGSCEDLVGMAGELPPLPLPLMAVNKLPPVQQQQVEGQDGTGRSNSISSG